MEDSITKDELHAIGNAKQKAVLTSCEARLAESEAKNLILQIYNKYGLKVGEDQILETGKIVRKPEVEIETTEVKPAGETEG